MEPEGIALVTGASRGIGRAVALELAGQGFEVLATMRDPAAGADLPDRAAAAGGRLRVAQLDVTKPDALPIPEGLRVLVNNAALDGAYLPVEETPLSAWRRLFETNFFGTVELTRRAIPTLRAAAGGVICNVTSAALLFPMPFYGVYRASKAALASFGESLRAELSPFGIRVVEVLPGPIETDMLAASNREPEAAAHAPYRALAHRAHERRRSVEGQTTSAAVAARAIVASIRDDTGPLRHACDPVGAGMLSGWRAASDEDWMRAMLASLDRVPPR